MTTHKIKSGETLTSIAGMYNTTVDEIAKANGIQNKNLIYAGDTLNIPSVKSLGGYTSVESTPYTGTPYKVSTDLSTDAEKAKAKIENWEKERPKSYKSAYSQSIDSLVEELLSMKFDGNIENDPLFNLTRDESIKQGLLAMEDTLGKALSMTGGYANSYAQSAAQGAYAKELSGYTQLIPELYEAAYDRFSDERESVKDAVKLLRSLDDSDFDRYTDMMKQYLSEGEMLFDNYNTLSKEEFDRFLDYASLLQKAAK